MKSAFGALLAMCARKAPVAGGCSFGRAVPLIASFSVGRAFPLLSDRTLRGRGNAPGVFGHHAGDVRRFWGLVRGHPRGDLLVREVDVQAPGFDVERDLVAVPDRRDRSAPDRLGSHVAGHQPMGGTGEAATWRSEEHTSELQS